MRKDLTPREIQIAKLIADGLKNKEIGEILFLSPKTVQSYLKRIFVKMNVQSRSAVAIKAIKLGIIDMPEGKETPVSANLNFFCKEMQEGKIKFVTREMVFGKISK